MKIRFSGEALLSNPQLNKGTAFSERERRDFALSGKLPPRIESIEMQTARVLAQLQKRIGALEKNLFLNELYAVNRTLFFKVVDLNLEELLPIIYTPTIGDAVMEYSLNFVNPQGLIIGPDDLDRIDEIFAAYDPDELDIAVVTDGEGVLGIGDQGIGGLNIAIGKLMVYTACAGINPFKTLPIQLDVGTNNRTLLEDPLYLGLRKERMSGQPYYEFIERFVTAFKKRFKKSFLHWEDFGKDNARKVLDLYRTAHPSFNDDIQGTGAIALAAVLTGIRKSGVPSDRHRFCIFGAGTAGVGIADQICQGLAELENSSIEEVRRRFYLIDRHGLIRQGQDRTLDFQKPYIRTYEDMQGWVCTGPQECTLSDTLRHAGITVLIGCSTASGAFNAEVLQQMHKNTPHPIILPLSNPTSKAEATPVQIIEATNGKAFIATGSPFDPVEYDGRTFKISQCNNALVYPGIALGMLISSASQLTERMLFAASMAVSENCNTDAKNTELLPALQHVKKLSAKVAVAVAMQAAAEGLAEKTSEDSLHEKIAEKTWQPEYAEYFRAD
ncbi:MAG: NAD-dependent malic enzyme [Candidatus Rifleibacteriota bacterium]